MLRESIEAAASALARGAPLEALSLVGNRSEPIALALRGMALAQMREYESARRFLKDAASAFDGESAPLSRARALAALAEISVAERDLASAERELDAAAKTLADLGDRTNAVWTRLLQARLAAFNGGLDRASEVIARAAEEAADAPAAIRAAIHLARAEVLARLFEPAAALSQIELAAELLAAADNPLLFGELEAARSALHRDVVEIRCGDERATLSPLSLEARLAGASELFVDAVRREIRAGETVIALGRRPVLFELAHRMSSRWPSQASGDELIERAFATTSATDADREKLRVELSRLRKVIESVAAVVATNGGWRLEPTSGAPVATLSPLYRPEFAPLSALLSDGELWTAKALSAVLGTSARTIARHLSDMVADGLAVPIGEGRMRRYSAQLRSTHLAGQMLSLGLLGR